MGDAGCPPIAQPAANDKCALVTLHDVGGCVTSFRCEPASCIRVDEPEPQPSCIWFPVRDDNGCTVSFDCLPGQPRLSLPFHRDRLIDYHVSGIISAELSSTSPLSRLEPATVISSDALMPKSVSPPGYTRLDSSSYCS